MQGLGARIRTSRRGLSVAEYKLGWWHLCRARSRSLGSCQANPGCHPPWTTRRIHAQRHRPASGKPWPVGRKTPTAEDHRTENYRGGLPFPRYLVKTITYLARGVNDVPSTFAPRLLDGRSTTWCRRRVVRRRGSSSGCLLRRRFRRNGLSGRRLRRRRNGRFCHERRLLARRAWLENSRCGGRPGRKGLPAIVLPLEIVPNLGHPI